MLKNFKICVYLLYCFQYRGVTIDGRPVGEGGGRNFNANKSFSNIKQVNSV